MNLYKRIQRKGMKDIAEPAAFLTQEAKREIVRSKRRNKGSRAVYVEESAASIPCGGPALEDTIADRDRLRTVQATVRAMPLLTSKVLVLFCYFDMSIASIAEGLDISVDAVKSRLSRARREVRARLSWED